jgi:TonB family protein
MDHNASFHWSGKRASGSSRGYIEGNTREELVRFTIALQSGLLILCGCAVAESGTRTVTPGQKVRIGAIPTIPNGVVRAPKLLVFTAPNYTQAGLAERIEGAVTLEAAFDDLGRFTILRVISGLGFGLDESALAAVKDWKFAAADRNDVPVPVIAQIQVEFRLPKELAQQEIQQRLEELKRILERLDKAREAGPHRQ